MATLNIIDFNAVPDATTLSTQAIQRAIDHASAGDTVLIPAGRFLSGSLFLKSNLTLQLAEGAVLLGSERLEDYAKITTRVAGIDMVWPAALLNVNHCQNVTVSGSGTIDGQGAVWWRKFWGDDESSGMLADYSQRGLRWVVDYDCERPRNLLVYESENVTLEEFTSRESGFWNIHVCYSQQVYLQGLNVHNSTGPSTDGIDIDSSQQVRVEKCTVSCNDDNICVKAGRGKEAQQLARTACDIAIRNCTLLKGSGITLGSETSGGIENVLIEHNHFSGTGVGFRIKSARNRGGWIKNVTVRHLTLEDVCYPFMLQLNWFPQYSYGEHSVDPDWPPHWRKLTEGVEGEAGLTQVDNIAISHVSSTLTHPAAFSRAFFIEGAAERPIEGLCFSEIRLQAQEFGKIAGVNRLVFDQVTLDAPAITLSENDVYHR
ncbi:glycoside hydrolase family 28 protein [Pantoea sp. RRHST58]|uniref:glycoside hydrolase family 28 protein n=1 Tax=Pantoea sp. RRHST58 TaxID=3425183 RepID=UPI003DA11BA4